MKRLAKLTPVTITHAAVGVIQHENGLVLLAQRPIGKPWAGYWEFPGGKIEANETPLHALTRELQEELGITVTLAYPWLTRTFDYEANHDSDGVLETPAKTVKLHFFIVTQWQGEPAGLECQALSWQGRYDLHAPSPAPPKSVGDPLGMPSLRTPMECLYTYCRVNAHKLSTSSEPR